MGAQAQPDYDALASQAGAVNYDALAQQAGAVPPQTDFAPPPGTPSLTTAAKPNVQMQSASGPERFATSLAAGTGDLLQAAATVRGQGTPDSMDTGGGAYDEAKAMLAKHQAPLQELEGAVRGMVQPVKDIANEAQYDKADALGDAIPLAATLVGGEREAVRSTRAPRAEFAEHQITKLIKPSAADLKYGAEPAASLPREGIVGSSLESLGEQVNSRAHKVGQAIDAVLSSPENKAKVVDISAAVNGPIDAAEANATRAGDKALFAKLQALREQVNHTWQVVEDENGNRQLAPQAPRQLQMPPAEAVQLKRDIADMTRWTGDPVDPAINGVRAQIFGKIKDAVNATVPEVAGLNNRYADLVHAAKAIERRAPVADRNAAFSLGDMGAAGLGVAVGHSTPAAAALLAAHKVARSPGFVSRVARAAMPSELMYEDPDTIIARAQGGSQAPAPATAPKALPPGQYEMPPSSTENVQSRSGSAAGAARENEILQQVSREHPEWGVSQKLQEAAKRSEAVEKKPPHGERRQSGETGPRAKLRTQAERDAALRKTMAETAERLGPITPDELRTGVPTNQEAEDVLSGRKTPGGSIR